MRSVVFVAPFFAETTLRFVRAAATLPGVRLGLVSQDPLRRLPAEVAAPLAAHRQVRDGMDPQQIADAVRDLQRELGPVQTLLGALEQLQETLADVRKALGIPGMDRETALNFRDKARMKETLRSAGVGCARHALAENAAEALAAVEHLGLPLVIKPPDGAGARQTMRIETTDDLRSALRVMPPRVGAPILLEEFIVGEEHSFDTISIAGRHVWHSLTHYRPGPLEVMENPWIQWTVLLPREVDHPRYNDIRQVASQALDALGMRTGLTHMEWFRRRDGSIAVSEVAARPPGAQFTTLISYAHDVDFYRSWARAMIEETFEIPRRAYSAGIAYLRGQGQGRVRAIHGLERAQQELGSLVAEVRLPRIGQHPAGSYEGEGYVVLRDRDTERVSRGLARLVELIRVELGPVLQP